mgnify:CR=1 FL=1
MLSNICAATALCRRALAVRQGKPTDGLSIFVISLGILHERGSPYFLDPH